MSENVINFSTWSNLQGDCKAIQIIGFDEDHETNFDTNVCAKK